MIDMRSLTLAAAVGAGLLALAPSATAGFEGPYLLANWSSSGIKEGTTTMSSGEAMEFSYGAKQGGGCENRTMHTASFFVPAAGDGTVSFDWIWTGVHDFPTGHLDVYAYSPSGLTVIPLYVGPVDVSFSLNGSASIDVTAGYDFGITVGQPECANPIEGTVRITNLAAPAAGFTEDHAADHWTTTGIPDGTTSIVGVCETAAQFSYDVDLGRPGLGVPFQTATFSVPAAITGTVSFNWQWTGFHAWFLASGILQVFAESSSGTTVIDLYDGGVQGDFSFNGSASIDVEAGYEFGIIVGGSNEDSTSLLNGTVTLTNFVSQQPGFVGSNGIANWGSTGIIDGTVAIGADLTTPSELAEFLYFVEVGGKQGGVPLRTATFSVPAAEDGTIAFDCDWEGFHARHNAYGVLQAFADGPSGTTVIDLYDGGLSGPFCICGSASIDVTAGYDFGIIVGGSNQDGAVPVISGTVRVTNLTVLCAADLDGDGQIGITDLLALLASWGTDPGGPPDFDGNGDVGITDLLVLLAAWGPC